VFVFINMIIFDFACKDRKISENYSYICSKSCESASFSAKKGFFAGFCVYAFRLLSL